MPFPHHLVCVAKLTSQLAYLLRQVGTTYTHPLAGRSSMVVEGGDYITTESGTGLVHTAPGHTG